MKDVEVHELQRTNTILSVTNHVRWDVGVNIAIGPFGVSASGQMSQDELRERHTTNDTRETDTKFTITIKVDKQIVITTAKSVTATVYILVGHLYPWRKWSADHQHPAER